MIRRLRDERDTLAEHLQDLQESTRLPSSQLEKDFWLTEALRGVAETADELGIPVYFKGGTSLSKVYGIIERFSEDVDVLVGLPKTGAVMSANQRKRTLEQLANGAGAATGLTPVVDPAKTRKGDKRAVHLPYPEAGDHGLGMPPLRPEGVMVELGRWGGSQPHQQTQLGSVLAGHADDLGLEPFEEQTPLTINVVDPVRTAVEKLLLLQTAAADPDEQRRRTVARHDYDVWCLLRHPPTSRQLQQPDTTASIADDVVV